MDWEGGIPLGTIGERKYSFRFQIHNKKISKDFSFSKCGGKEEAKQQAEKYRYIISNEMGLTKNKWRYIENGRYIEMQLTRNKTVIFDAEEFPKLKSRVWHANTSKVSGLWYAETQNGPHKIKMHQLICPDYRQVDHRDGNGLNNTKANLRDGSGGVNGNNKRMRSDNKSGQNGIAFRGCYVTLQWYEGRKQKTRSFRFSTEETKQSAFQQAIDYRDNVIYPRIKNNNGKRPKIQ